MIDVDRTDDALVCVAADGKAVVIQDDLRNTYQRLNLSASARLKDPA